MSSEDPFKLKAARALFGVTRIPELLNPQEIPRLVALYYTPELRASRLSGAVIVSADIDAEGHVSHVKAVRAASGGDVYVFGPIAGPSEKHGVVDASGHDPDPRIRAAAEAVVRGLRFRPAELDGTPVSFWDLRFGLHLPP